MSEIEALLSVDAGRIPAGAIAFYPGEVDRAERRTYLVLAVMATAAAVACLGLGAGRTLVALLLLAAAALALLATPTAGDDDEPVIKRPVMVVTPQALIVRDEHGLNVWHFDELAGVSAMIYDQRPQLVLASKDGKRHLVDFLRFQHGERVRDVIDQRLKQPRTQAG